MISPKRNPPFFFLAILVLPFSFGIGLSPLFPLRSAEAGNASQKTLSIAAASNLRFAMDALVVAFEAEREIKLKVAYGASGSLFAQIVMGAPYDIFFSADEDIPKQLVKKGLAEEDSFFIYGVGKIVLWVPKGSLIDLEKEEMESLLHPSIHKIAIANPRYAPYGKAAMVALKKRGLLQKIQQKLVLGENVSHAAQFIQSGGAEIGILSYSLAISPPLKQGGRYWKIPEERGSRLNQGALILTRTQKPELSRSFMDFVREGRGKAILIKYGLSTEPALP